MTEQSEVTANGAVDILRFRDAYQQKSAEIAAVAEDDLVQVNVEIPVAVPTVLGAWPKIRALRPRFAKELPMFPIERFDALEAYTLALGHAHTLHMAASAPVESMPALVEECMTVRETMVMDTKTLAHRGLLDGTRLRELKGPNGHRLLAFDLFLLAQILRESWAKIEGKTALTLAELNKAESLADRLTTAVGVREQTSTAGSSTGAMRERAFTLFIKTYNEVRRAVLYLCPNDGDEIAPTVYIGRPSGKKRPEPELDQPAAQTPVAADTPAKTAAPSNGGISSDSPYSAS